MTRIKRVIKFVKLNNYHSHFALELLLLIIMVITVGGNLLLKANFKGTSVSERSLLFAFLKKNPEMNQKLFDTYESYVQLAEVRQSGLPAARQVLAASTVASSKEAPETKNAELPVMGGSALLKPNPASSSALPHKDIEVYAVRGGDTVSRIAAAYGIDERTIISENNLSSTGNIKPGQELRILPTTGVIHTVKDGETMEKIAKKYDVELEDILDYNEIEIEDLIAPGDVIITPHGVKPVPPTPQRQQYLADVKKEDYKKSPSTG